MEKRVHPRVNTDRMVQLRLSSGAKVQARMINISLGGIAIDYPRPTDNGIELGLAFSLPLQTELCTIEARARTCYSHIYRRSYSIGLEFIAIRKQYLQQIAKFIEYKHLCHNPEPGFVVDHRTRDY